MSALLDADVLDMLTEAIGVEGAQAVIALFLDECRDLAAAIAAPGAERTAVGRAAHSLKSSAGQLGALALSKAAEAVETAASTASADLPRLAAALAECAVESEEALTEKLK